MRLCIQEQARRINKRAKLTTGSDMRHAERHPRRLRAESKIGLGGRFSGKHRARCVEMAADNAACERDRKRAIPVGAEHGT
jgi:hypothetical protein